MSSNSSSVILGLSIVVAAGIYAAPSLIKEFVGQNVIKTTNGVVRLGKIYNEALKVRLEMKNSETGVVFISVDVGADQVSNAGIKELENIIKAMNKEAGGKEEKLSADAVALKVGMTITVTSYVSYRSEYQPAYELTLDEHVTTAGVGANIKKTLQQAQEYCDTVKSQYVAGHQGLSI